VIAPVWDIAYTTDDASDTTPSWTNVAVANIRSVDVSRGRDNELGRVDAGTAQLVLNNLTRSFDPQVVTGLRPMNRWRIRAVYNSVTYPVFLGYAESYEQMWPALGEDAVTVVRLVDEFKLLALDTLPAMSPPTAQTYADVVQFDIPSAYWRFEPTGTADPRIMAPTIGQGHFVNQSGLYAGESTPLIGDYAPGWVEGGVMARAPAREAAGELPIVDLNTYLDTGTLGMGDGDPGNMAGLSSFTFEVWFKSNESAPAADRWIARGPLSGGLEQWGIIHDTTTKVQMFVRNSGGTLYDTLSTTTLAANTWYHLAIVVDGLSVSNVINGVVEDDSGGWSGSVGAMDVGGYFALGHIGSPGGTRYFDEPAFYRDNLTADRLLAHYEAGALRGYPKQDPAVRAAAVVTDSSSVAGTSFADTIGREITPVFHHGQSVLDELRNAELAEQGFLFIANDGTITMLQAGYQGISPYNVVQATFDDDGTDLPYRDLTVDYSETFLYNEVTISVVGGELYTDDDATSISRYGKRTLSMPEMPIVTVGDITSVAANLLTAYKDPITRVTSLSVYLKSTAVIAAVLPLDLGDLIRVFRTHPGGGARLDQQLHVQRVQLSAPAPGQAWTVTLGVSPL
jgi:hypothetical protein